MSFELATTTPWIILAAWYVFELIVGQKHVR